ncbi:DUF177 domain-containing protein [Myxococcota bacterium]|nr:DUF177 domain-containing protein [Myxococcota bacterium]MBU1534313.1 DUF177 domain-containing protein [Myxococcota bacterium]
MKPLLVHIGELAAGPREIEFSFTEQELEEHLEDLAAPRAFHRVKGILTLEQIAGAIEVTGHMEGFITVQCSRCLKPTRVDVPEFFQFIFIEEPDHFDSETELSGNDLETAFFHGDTIDLEPHIWDHVILSVPMVPLCDEACEGITYPKGKELRAPLENSPWEALKNIKITK